MSSNPQLPRGSRIWPRLSIVLIAGFVLYYAYVALNTWGLADQTGGASVLEKAHYAPGTSYQTLRIGGRAFVRPYQTAEAYILKLQLNGREAPAVVEKSSKIFLGRYELIVS